MTSTTHDERLVPTPGGPDERDGGDPEGPPRRRPRLFTTLAVIIGGLALAGGAWYVSQALTKPGGQSIGELPLLVADTSPVKIRPEDPGGAEVPNRDKYVYKSLEGEPSEQPVEQLLPAPEEPMARPVDVGPPIEPLVSVALDTMWAKPAAEARPPVKALPAIEQPSSIERETLSPPEKPSPGTEASNSESRPTETAAVAPIAEGAWLQVAALRDEAAVEVEWRRLVKRFPSVLGKLERRTERVDLGDKGLWFRVQAGPMTDRASADAACRTLAAQGGSCKVVAPL